MDEISKEVLYNKLLAYGLFSEKLPPIFDSTLFADFCEKDPAFNSNRDYDYVRFDAMRNINIPRQIGIPVPMAYERLCKVLRDHWSDIQNHFREKTKNQKDYVISRIHLQLRKTSPELFVMNYDDWRNGGSPSDDLIIGNRFMVEVDISNCFSSIYTHSISWALVGKKTAKESKKTVKNSPKMANEGKEQDLWYDTLDKACRNMKWQETKGILIGPHASNLISEIILTAIDCELYENYKYIRHIDDYTCYVKSEEEATYFIQALECELEKFDLHLNYKKTKISRLPNAGVADWVGKLNQLGLLYTNRIIGYKDIRGFFSSLIDLVHRNNDDAAILKYAVKMMSKFEMSDGAKTYSWKMWMQLCLLYPYLVSLMDSFVFKPFHTPQEKIEVFANRAYELGKEYRNYEECCYALLLAIDYNFKISQSVEEGISAVDNCLYKLVAAIYCKKYDKTAFNGLKALAQQLQSDDMDRNWPFVYEMLKLGDFDNDDDWRKLKKARVSFLREPYRIK